jgi:hypothetical protein
MKRFSLIAIAIFGVFLLNATVFAQLAFKEFFPVSDWQSNRVPSLQNTRNEDNLFRSEFSKDPELVSSTLVISQVYGGAGCGTASCSSYQNDYIEIFNRGSSPVNLSGWSVQYAAATGTLWQVTALPNYTIQPGKYYLVAEGFGANGINPLPVPDATGTVAMSATAGKVALVNSTTALTGACPAGAQIIDFVGYGTTPNCSESAPAPAPSTTTADLRKNGGIQDTDNNSNDFTAVAPTPRNSASPANGVFMAINDVSQSEGNAGTTNFTFTVSLNTAAHGGVTFDIATADDTATTADNDYAANSLTGQTIPNGTQNYTFTMSVNGDTSFEPNETFFVNVTNVTGAIVTDGQGQGTIVNDDAAAAIVGFSSLNYTEDESQTAILTVTRSGDLSGTTTVDYSTQKPANLGFGPAATGGASCTSGVDFVHQSGTLTFDVDQNFKEIQIGLCRDSIVESHEFFNVYLSNAGGGVIGEIPTAQVQINDTANEFVDTDQIFIGTGGDTYFSSIEVSGVPGNIGGLRVTLFDFSHLTADDIDVLLVGPQGQKFLLMADAGGADGLAESATLTFDDTAGRVLPDAAQIFSGRYEPTTWQPGQTDFPAPAPAGPYSEPGSEVGGAVTLASVFGNTNANGVWTLYIRDDNNALQPLGADGVVAGGWGLQFLAPTAANVSVSGQVRTRKTPISNTTVMITGGNLTAPLFTKTNNFGNYQFEGLAVGETYVVTVVSKRYNFPQSSIVVSLEDSVTGADFEAEER